MPGLRKAKGQLAVSLSALRHAWMAVRDPSAAGGVFLEGRVLLPEEEDVDPPGEEVLGDGLTIVPEVLPA